MLLLQKEQSTDFKSKEDLSGKAHHPHPVQLVIILADIKERESV